MKQLGYYYIQFDNMRRAKCNGINAPHKPILLLTIVDLVSSGEILSNKIALSDILINGFYIKWKELVDNGNHEQSFATTDGLTIEIGKRYPFKCSIANPFYHLQTEPFWRLHKSERYVKSLNNSIKTLKNNFDYAEIDEELFRLMKDGESANLIRQHLLNSL